jgi:hypothetical protein
MKWTEVRRDTWYELTYPANMKSKKPRLVRAIRSLSTGDIEVAYKNGRRDIYHATWLEPITPCVK